MQEKSTTKDTIAQSRTNLYTNIYSKIVNESSSVTYEQLDNTNVHLLHYPSHGGESKQQRVDYKGVPIYKGRKYHVSFKDEVTPMQELVTYVNIPCFKEDYDVDSDIDFSNSNSNIINNSSNTKSLSSLSEHNNNNSNMTMHNNKYFINYKNCCCNIT